MPTLENGRQAFTLLEVMLSIQKTLQNRYRSAFWVKAEMNKLNYYKQSGHCHPELVEKQDGKIIAQLKSILWKDDYPEINNKFLQTLKEPLKDGIKILFLAQITFKPPYGLTLRILDVDPSFTLGDLQKEKQESITRLQEEGIFYKNKLLQLALLPQRIAIISVATSDGYADFLKIIEGNPWKYKFFHYLFPSLLQGDNAVNGIIKQLRNIKKVIHHFDAVAIIRGGGGDIGLSCYNHYTLSKEIALFPIPVLTGIGHVTNETVVEMVSFYNAITPTKLAEYLIQHFHDFAVPVQKAQESIIDKSIRWIKDEKTIFQSEIKLFRSVTGNLLLKNRTIIHQLTTSLIRQSEFACRNQKDLLRRIQGDIRRNTVFFCQSFQKMLMQFSMGMKKDVVSQFSRSKLMVAQLSHQVVKDSVFVLNSRIEKINQSGEKLVSATKTLLKNNHLELSTIEKNLEHLSPQQILKRGYSITLLNGKAVKSIDQVNPQEKLITIVADGSIRSTIQSTNKTAGE